MQRISKTAIFNAARAWDAVSLARMLGASPELVAATDPKGRTALHLACAVTHGGAALGFGATTNVSAVRSQTETRDLI